jgi:hypothetical protein
MTDPMNQDEQPASLVVVEAFKNPSVRTPQLNVQLHARLMREGTTRPSTLESAMRALALMRQA